MAAARVRQAAPAVSPTPMTGWPAALQSRRVAAASTVGLLWGATLFLSAVLTFSVQPLYARLLLPRLGGAPAVLVVTLLFFQTALLVGYAYAHLLTRIRPLGVQVAVHGALLLAAALTLPPALRAAPDVAAPALSAVAALAGGVGLPYVVLVATAPLVQHWFARGRAAGDPDVLYAASNGGSLAGLLLYPFLLEPLLGLRQQADLWAAAYAGAALLIAGCGLLASRLAHARGAAAAARQGAAAAGAGATVRDAASLAAATDTAAGARIGLRQYARWMGLAALPTLWLGAASTYVTTAVAPVPLLWVLPLAAYLLTLVLAFAPKRLRPTYLTREHVGRLARVVVTAAALCVAVRAIEPAAIVVGVHLAALFAGALTCHLALAAGRPAPQAATAYYLALAAGGAAGGALAAVAAPLVFHTLLEYPLSLALFVTTGLAAPTLPAAAASGMSWRTYSGARRQAAAGVAAAGAAAAALVVAFGAPHWFLVPILLGGGVLLSAGASRRPRLAGGALLLVLLVADGAPLPGGYRQGAVVRSFFGVNRVLTSADGSQRILLNGLIGHGTQVLDPARAATPQGYYTREGPLGDILRDSAPAAAGGVSERVGVVGLGAGTIACYGSPQRRVTFFEIDPAVIAIARDPAQFTYLDRCPPEAVIVGDGRLSLEATADGAFDVLVIDAYSGDTMPLHLLTREAFGVYRRVLAPGGVVALHVSNKFFDLEPLVAALAADTGWAGRIRDDGTGEHEGASTERAPGWSPSVWTLVGDERDVAGRLEGAPDWRPLRARPGLRVWTDDYANPLAIRR